MLPVVFFFGILAVCMGCGMNGGMAFLVALVGSFIPGTVIGPLPVTWLKSREGDHVWPIVERTATARASQYRDEARQSRRPKERRFQRKRGGAGRLWARHCASRRGLVPQWVYAVSTPIIARSNESVAKSDANGITVTNARESVQASRGGGANDAGIETAAEWGVFFSDAIPLPAHAIVYVLAYGAIVHSLAAWQHWMAKAPIVGG